MWLVVGLGNPDREYAGHRHNVGFMVVDRLAAQCEADSWRNKFAGELARGTLKDEDAWLLKPMTYMNLSGDSVQPCAAFFKIPPNKLIVVHDELDLPFGTVRIKIGGGHGGHNGIRSVTERMGTPDYIRIRVGIGRPPPEFQGEVSSYVLSNFRLEQREKLSIILKTATRSVIDIASRGVSAAMKRTNTRLKPKKQASETSTKPDADKASTGEAPDTTNQNP